MSIFKFDDKHSFIDEYLIKYIDFFNKEELLMYLSFQRLMRENDVITRSVLENCVINELSIFDCSSKEEKEQLKKTSKDKSLAAINNLKEKGLLVEFDDTFIFTKTLPVGDFVHLSSYSISNLSETLLEEVELKTLLKVVFEKRRKNQEYVLISELDETLVQKLIELMIVNETETTLEFYL